MNRNNVAILWGLIACIFMIQERWDACAVFMVMYYGENILHRIGK